MNRYLVAAASLTALSEAVLAQDVARVVSSTAITQQVGVPRQACATYATPGVPPQCSTQMIFENRTVGYNVVYEHAGKRFSVQLPQDPGPTLRLQAGAAEVTTLSTAAPTAAATPPPGMRIASVVPAANVASAPLHDPGLPEETTMFAQPYPPPVQVTYAYPGYATPHYAAPNYAWGAVLGLGLIGAYGAYHYGGRHHYGSRWHGHRGHGRRR